MDSSDGSAHSQPTFTNHKLFLKCRYRYRRKVRDWENFFFKYEMMGDDDSEGEPLLCVGSRPNRGKKRISPYAEGFTVEKAKRVQRWLNSQDFSWSVDDDGLDKNDNLNINTFDVERNEIKYVTGESHGILSECQEEAPRSDYSGYSVVQEEEEEESVVVNHTSHFLETGSVQQVSEVKSITSASKQGKSMDDPESSGISEIRDLVDAAPVEESGGVETIDILEDATPVEESGGVETIDILEDAAPVEESGGVETIDILEDATPVEESGGVETIDILDGDSDRVEKPPSPGKAKVTRCFLDKFNVEYFRQLGFEWKPDVNALRLLIEEDKGTKDEAKEVSEIKSVSVSRASINDGETKISLQQSPTLSKRRSKRILQSKNPPVFVDLTSMSNIQSKSKPVSSSMTKPNDVTLCHELDCESPSKTENSLQRNTILSSKSVPRRGNLSNLECKARLRNFHANQTVVAQNLKPASGEDSALSSFEGKCSSKCDSTSKGSYLSTHEIDPHIKPKCFNSTASTPDSSRDPERSFRRNARSVVEDDLQNGTSNSLNQSDLNVVGSSGASDTARRMGMVGNQTLVDFDSQQSSPNHERKGEFSHKVSRLTSDKRNVNKIQTNQSHVGRRDEVNFSNKQVTHITKEAAYQLSLVPIVVIDKQAVSLFRNLNHGLEISPIDLEGCWTSRPPTSNIEVTVEETNNSKSVPDVNNVSRSPDLLRVEIEAVPVNKKFPRDIRDAHDEAMSSSPMHTRSKVKTLSPEVEVSVVSKRSKLSTTHDLANMNSSQIASEKQRNGKKITSSQIVDLVSSVSLGSTKSNDLLERDFSINKISDHRTEQNVSSPRQRSRKNTSAIPTRRNNSLQKSCQDGDQVSCDTSIACRTRKNSNKEQEFTNGSNVTGTLSTIQSFQTTNHNGTNKGSPRKPYNCYVLLNRIDERPQRASRSGKNKTEGEISPLLSIQNGTGTENVIVLDSSPLSGSEINTEHQLRPRGLIKNPMSYRPQCSKVRNGRNACTSFESDKHTSDMDKRRLNPRRKTVASISSVESVPTNTFTHSVSKPITESNLPTQMKEPFILRSLRWGYYSHKTAKGKKSSVVFNELKDGLSDSSDVDPHLKITSIAKLSKNASTQITPGKRKNNLSVYDRKSNRKTFKQKKSTPESCSRNQIQDIESSLDSSSESDKVASVCGSKQKELSKERPSYTLDKRLLRDNLVLNSDASSSKQRKRKDPRLTRFIHDECKTSTSIKKISNTQEPDVIFLNASNKKVTPSRKHGSVMKKSSKNSCKETYFNKISCVASSSSSSESLEYVLEDNSLVCDQRTETAPTKKVSLSIVSESDSEDDASSEPIPIFSKPMISLSSKVTGSARKQNEETTGSKGPGLMLCSSPSDESDCNYNDCRNLKTVKSVTKFNVTKLKNQPVLSDSKITKTNATCLKSSQTQDEDDDSKKSEVPFIDLCRSSSDSVHGSKAAQFTRRKSKERRLTKDSDVLTWYSDETQHWIALLRQNLKTRKSTNNSSIKKKGTSRFGNKC